MNDQQIDAAVASATVTNWVTSTEAHLTAEQTVGLRQEIAALVRRVRDAEQERCAVKVDAMRNGHTIEVTSGVLIPDEDGPWFLKSDIAAAIRAPRTEEKR